MQYVKNLTCFLFGHKWVEQIFGGKYCPRCHRLTEAQKRIILQAIAFLDTVAGEGMSFETEIGLLGADDILFDMTNEFGITEAVENASSYTQAVRALLEKQQ